MDWFAYEIADDSGYTIGAYTTSQERDEAFERDLVELGGLDNVETYILGAVRGDDLPMALDAIRMGDWLEYTQRC